jgi:hypothetical protein
MNQARILVFHPLPRLPEVGRLLMLSPTPMLVPSLRCLTDP